METIWDLNKMKNNTLKSIKINVTVVSVVYTTLV